MSTARTVTIIPVMYRSASNYKAFREYVLDGAITDEQVGRLEASLDGDCFLPAQLGEDHVGTDEFTLTEDEDHPWHEIVLDEIEVQEDSTRPCNLNSCRTVDEFVASMERAKSVGWDSVTYDAPYEEPEDDCDEDGFEEFVADAPLPSDGPGVQRHEAGSPASMGGKFKGSTAPATDVS